MFSVGDIVEWAQPDFGDVTYFGVVEEIRGDFNKSFTVRWFDDGLVNDYPYQDLKLVIKVS
jgi:hypothetical protein